MLLFSNFWRGNSGWADCNINRSTESYFHFMEVTNIGKAVKLKLFFICFKSNKGLVSMKKTWVYLSLLVSALVLTACNSNDPKKISLESEDDKTFYAMGY